MNGAALGQEGAEGVRSAGPGGWRSLGGVDGFDGEPGGVVLYCGAARLRVRAVDNGVVRVRLAPRGDFGRDHSWSVAAPPAETTDVRIEESQGALRLVTAGLVVQIAKHPCRVSFIPADGAVVGADDPTRGIAWAGDEVCCWKVLDDDDHFFGLGEKGPPLDRRNTCVVNWNHDAAEHEPWTDPLYQTHPFFICLNAGRAYGVFFDNTHRSFFDFGKSSAGCYSFGADGGEMNYYFLLGPTPQDVLRRYARLVGTMPLPPRWALGYQQCRWSYPTARRVREIARQFRRRRIPCDAIYLDIDYMDGFRCFTWNPRHFPSPAALMRDLAKRGFRVVTIIDPGIKREPGYWVYDQGLAGDHFCRRPDGQPYVGQVWPGKSVFPDFTRRATRNWWGELYRGIVEAGVTGFWNDMNEPADFTIPQDAGSPIAGTIPLDVRFDGEGHPTDHREVHNIYGMLMARATCEGLRRLRPGHRPFVLTRAGYAGVQRYAAVWTGDNRSSWEHLRMSLPMLLNMGLSGLVFCGADIGGFRGVPSPELFTRWLQLGIFYPLCRTHTARGPDQEPWSYGRQYEAVNRAAIELRYRLLPYLYTEMHHAARTGVPVMRPLLLDFPAQANVHRCEHEFLFGRQLLAAPVLEAGATRRTVPLPAGAWCDFFTGRRYASGTTIEQKVDLASIPLFARAGAVIPTGPVVQHVDERPLDEVTLQIYPGTGGGSFYHDDGISYDFERGDFTYEEYQSDQTADGWCFRLAARHGGERFAPARYVLKFLGVNREPAAVTLGGSPVPHFGSLRQLQKAPVGWSYNRSARMLVVGLPRLDVGENLEVLTRPGRAPAGRRASRSRRRKRTGPRR